MKKFLLYLLLAELLFDLLLVAAFKFIYLDNYAATYYVPQQNAHGMVLFSPWDDGCIGLQWGDHPLTVDTDSRNECQ